MFSRLATGFTLLVAVLTISSCTQIRRQRVLRSRLLLESLLDQFEVFGGYLMVEFNALYPEFRD